MDIFTGVLYSMKLFNNTSEKVADIAHEFLVLNFVS